MPKISDATLETIKDLNDKIRMDLEGSTSLEEAAQKFAGIFYRGFEESIVLVRLFATIPYEYLPAPNQAFVNRLATSQDISHLIHDQTLVLSLLGTQGENASWNDRHNSEDHAGIPLASADFIDAIPMMSRLLKELGVSLDWIDDQDTKMVLQTEGKMAGLFYVPDARVTVDNKGRKIIAAQDFVADSNVKTVFGFGGGYRMSLTNETFITVIIFTRETIERSQVEMFKMLSSVIKTATMKLVSNGNIFS